MIKLEHVVLASPEQMAFIIEGMRNPMNSWEKSDSKADPDDIGTCDEFILGKNDHSLMQRLAKAGTEHRKYMRMMSVYVRITAPLYWWKEFDTYKIGTVANSCSTMHKIAEKEFTFEDFSCEHLISNPSMDESDTSVSDAEGYMHYEPREIYSDWIIPSLNKCRNKYLETKDKKYWWQMIQLLPSSYNQTRNVMMNYEVLANIYKSRKNHKLYEWCVFCKWIEELPYSELIIGEKAYINKIFGLGIDLSNAPDFSSKEK